MENVNFQLQRQGFKQGLFGKQPHAHHDGPKPFARQFTLLHQRGFKGRDGQRAPFDQHLAKQFCRFGGHRFYLSCRVIHAR